MPRHLYEALGVPHDATPEEIRKAYRKKALQTHPDRLPPTASAQDKTNAEEQFRTVNNAYEVLNDEEKRRAYDRHGEWPPPESQPGPEMRRRRHHEPHRHRTFDGAFRDPFSEPFISEPFGTRSRNMHSPNNLTDPFVLFDSIFGDIRRHVNDPFLSDSLFDDLLPASGFGRSPFGNGLPFDRPFGGPSPFGMLHPSLAFPSLDTPNGQGASFHSTSQGVFTRGPDGNGQWVAQSRTTRTVNGVTESVWKRRDANGNEHITHTYPDGRERYLINGIEQPRPVNNRDEQLLPPPRYPGPSTQPPSLPVEDKHRQSYDRRHSHERRTSEPRRYAPPPNPPPEPPVIPPANQHNSANNFYQTPQRRNALDARYESVERLAHASMKLKSDYDRLKSREHRRRQREQLNEHEEPQQKRKWWNR